MAFASSSGDVTLVWQRRYFAFNERIDETNKIGIFYNGKKKRLSSVFAVSTE